MKEHQPRARKWVVPGLVQARPIPGKGMLRLARHVLIQELAQARSADTTRRARAVSGPRRVGMFLLIFLKY